MAESNYESIKSIVEEITAGKSDIDKALVTELMEKVMKKGMNVKDAMGLSDAYLEKLYSDAYNLFQAGQYQKADGIFRLLMLFDPSDARFPMGSACCLHKMEKYAEAIGLYNLSSSLDSENFLPLYYASDCCIKNGFKPGATIFLKIVLDKIKNNPAHLTLKERIEKSILTLEREMGEE